MPRFAEKGDWRLPPALLLARGENRLFSPEEVRPICFCGTKKEAVRFCGQLTKYKSFACGERRLKSKNKSRLAAGDAPVQVASLSVFGNYKKHLRHFYILDSERFAARAPRITTIEKQERLKRTVLPKRVNVPLLLKETAF